ncbi:MAG: hypothetical protein HZC54_01750 [Verrucomicrobia bacterium]|nr:hypothetical protein [Verrucomicrobiota bacterium]
MPQDTVPKHPTDPNQTINAVLDSVLFRNKNKRRLVKYNNQATQIVLTYEACATPKAGP